MEIWVDIKGYEGVYQVSNYGRVKGLERVNYFGGRRRVIKEKILKGRVHTQGYLRVNLTINNEPKDFFIHRLVAEHFLENERGDAVYVNHDDGDKTNNHVSNLEWCTPSENNVHAFETGLSKGTPRVLNEEKVRFIRSNYIRRHSEWGVQGLAKKMGISESTVQSVINRKTWKHVV